MKLSSYLLSLSVLLSSGLQAGPLESKLTRCQTVFGIPGTDGQILGVEPIAGNALQADLTVASYQSHTMEFKSTIINYFNPETSTVHDITTQQSPGNNCKDAGMNLIAELSLESIHFTGFGLGNGEIGCFLGKVTDDVITHEPALWSFAVISTPNGSKIRSSGKTHVTRSFQINLN